jgi:hypothetical protein
VFSRNLGSTLGATVLGSVLNLSLSHAGAGTAAVDFDRIRQLLDHPGSLPGDAGVRLVLGQSLHFTFLSVFLIAVATLLVATLVPAVAFARRARHAPGE